MLASSLCTHNHRRENELDQADMICHRIEATKTKNIRSTMLTPETHVKHRTSLDPKALRKPNSTLDVENNRALLISYQNMEGSVPPILKSW